MLLKGLPEIEVRGSKEVEITGLSADSRTIAPGNLFIAKKGAVHDGSQYISEAISSGAAAIASDFYDPFLKKTQLIIQTPAFLEAELAARYYHHPSKDLLVVGVTGTKGKTTTAYLVQHLLEALGKKCGLVGSVETVIGDHRFASSLTTHDVIYNQKILREMVLKQCEAAAFEVSSHGLMQGRVDKIDFDIAIFTNLYPDHLDYHQTMEQYSLAKKKLFLNAKKNIVNLDSPWGSFMKGEREGVTFGVENKADVMASDIRFEGNKTTFWVEAYGQREKFTSSLIGRFNVYNLLAAICVGVQLGAPLEKISACLASFDSVPGRLQLVSQESGIKVFVDHAHTEEALDAALEAIRSITEKKVLLVFGCGGNRDPGRRSGMARAAEKWADLVIITNDNPRREDPQEICNQILSGFRNIEKITVELDRKKAIHQAISMAAAGDTVLIAGKGHEKVQVFAHQTISFDDAAVVKEALGLSMESI